MAEPIIAVGLLTQRDLDALGAGFTRAFPLDRRPCFDDLLQAIDEAERSSEQEREAAGQPVE